MIRTKRKGYLSTDEDVQSLIHWVKSEGDVIVAIEGSGGHSKPVENAFRAEKAVQQFFRDLAAHNDQAWFQANQERYERELFEPAVAFVGALGPRLARMYPSIHFGTQRNGSGLIMRIHRDVRFSPDKRPYKQNLGIIFWIGSGKKVELPCFYLNVEADRAFLYAGQHMFPKPVLARYRIAVDDEVTGTVLVKVLQKLERKDLRVLEEPAYKKVPSGFAKDHVRGELLRYGGIGVSVDLPPAALARADLPDACAEFASQARALVGWLCALND